jgi:hypothetical protein
VAVTLNGYSPPALGVPDRVPPLDRLRKEGNPVPDQLMVASPVAPSERLYGPPTDPFGSGLLVVMVGGVQSRIEVANVGFPFASVTFTVNELVVGVEPFGVPVIAPLPAFKVAQDGSAPDAMLQDGVEHPVVAIVQA